MSSALGRAACNSHLFIPRKRSGYRITITVFNSALFPRNSAINGCPQYLSRTDWSSFSPSPSCHFASMPTVSCLSRFTTMSGVFAFPSSTLSCSSTSHPASRGNKCSSTSTTALVTTFSFFWGILEFSSFCRRGPVPCRVGARGGCAPNTAGSGDPALQRVLGHTRGTGPRATLQQDSRTSEGYYQKGAA